MVRSWRTGYGPGGGYSFSHETESGVLVYTKSEETNHQTMGVDFLEGIGGMRLKIVTYDLYEHVWGHGLGITKIYRGNRIQFVGLAPGRSPPREWF